MLEKLLSLFRRSRTEIEPPAEKPSPSQLEPAKTEREPIPVAAQKKLVSAPAETRFVLRGGDSKPFAEISVRMSGPQPLPVPAEMLEAAYEQFRFIAENEPPPLDANDTWFVRDGPLGSDGLPAWMSPQLPRTDFRDSELRNRLRCEPNGLGGAAVAVRKRIRAKRKAKAPYREELDFLYRLAVLDDLVSKCVLPGLQDYIAMRSLSRADLARIIIDYDVIGYDSLRLLGVTDKKWLAEERGVPASHMSIADLYPDVIRKALVRHFWSELNNSNSYAVKLGREPETIEGWLRRHLVFHLGSQLEWEERMCRAEEEDARRVARASRVVSDPDDVLKALAGGFVVADLETTGLSPYSDAIIELGAIKVKGSFAASETFSTLVATDVQISAQIERITGITSRDLRSSGIPLTEAIGQFRSFVGGLPVLFHNAGFDQAFLERAFEKLRQPYDLRVCDTLELFRCIWPELPKHGLRDLCRELSVECVASHRALDDCGALLDLIRRAVEKSGGRDGTANA